jgi:hypothetical protein
MFQDPFSAFNQFFTIRYQLESCFRLFEERPARSELDHAAGSDFHHPSRGADRGRANEHGRR